jgi:alginate O-acetyltransferase complex protein AlgI
VGRVFGWTVTMVIVFVGWFFFRAASYPVLSGMIGALANWSWEPVHVATLRAVATAAFPVALIEWTQLRYKDDYFVLRWPRWLGNLALALLTFLCLVMMRDYRATFIYFQF